MHTDRGDLRAPLIVDALGWRRVLSNASAIQPPDAPMSRGLEVHPAGTGAELELWIDPRYIRSGYAWSFPARDEIRVGVGSFWPAHHVKEPTVRLAHDLGLPPDGYQGNWIPHKLRAAVEDEVFFAGDSAGHCLPLTAEGIRTALYFGLACGRELREVLDGRSTRAQALARYGAFSAAHERKYRWLLNTQRAIGQLTPSRAITALARGFESPRISRWAFSHYLAIAPPSFVGERPPSAGRGAHRQTGAVRSSGELERSGDPPQLRPGHARRVERETAASIALAQETSASSPGAATMSPARNTPSPRSIAGRSRQVAPGRSSAPERASIT